MSLGNFELRNILVKGNLIIFYNKVSLFTNIWNFLPSYRIPRIDNINPCHNSTRICINSRIGFVNISNGSVTVTGKNVLRHGYLKDYTNYLNMDPTDTHIYFIDLKENVYPGESLQIIIKEWVRILNIITRY